MGIAGNRALPRAFGLLELYIDLGAALCCTAWSHSRGVRRNRHRLYHTALVRTIRLPEPATRGSVFFRGLGDGRFDLMAFQRAVSTLAVGMHMRRSRRFARLPEKSVRPAPL